MQKSHYLCGAFFTPDPTSAEMQLRVSPSAADYPSKSGKVKKTPYQLPIATLGEGQHHYDFHLDAPFFGEQEREGILDSDIDAAVDINRRGDRYEVRCIVDGEITVACDRCLEPLQLPVEAEYNVNVTFGEDYDDTREGVLVLPYTARTLDIAPLLADTVLLTIPIRAVHEEGKCDPAMEALITE